MGTAGTPRSGWRLRAAPKPHSLLLLPNRNHNAQLWSYFDLEGTTFLSRRRGEQWLPEAAPYQKADELRFGALLSESQVLRKYTVVKLKLPGHWLGYIQRLRAATRGNRHQVQGKRNQHCNHGADHHPCKHPKPSRVVHTIGGTEHHL